LFTITDLSLKIGFEKCWYLKDNDFILLVSSNSVDQLAPLSIALNLVNIQAVVLLEVFIGSETVLTTHASP
jgi:hypothetical protein